MFDINIPIEINTDDITSQFDISQEQVTKLVDNVIKSIAFGYVETLETFVLKELHTSRDLYLSAISVTDDGWGKATISLDTSNKLVKAIEEGSAAYDEKAGLLYGPNSKVSKKGKRYNTVPFRVLTPSSTGPGEKMTRSIYDIVRKKGRIVADDIKNPVLGSRKVIQDSEGKVLFDAYQHKVPLMEGLTKVSDKTTGKSKYYTFRRVSENSDPLAFIHPGFRPHNLFSKALISYKVEEIAGDLIDNELVKLGF